MFLNSYGDPWEDFNNGDPFNSNHERNLKNTAKRTYNCAGYALETFSWYLPVPYYDSDELEWFDWGSFDTMKRHRLSVEFVNQILADFPDARLIDGLEEVDEKTEYAFAFRVGVDDFHFVKRGANHTWYEKRGSSPCIYRISEHDVFNSDWDDGRYNGPIFLFAKERTVIISAEDEKDAETPKREDYLNNLLAGLLAF